MNKEMLKWVKVIQIALWFLILTAYYPIFISTAKILMSSYLLNMIIYILITRISTFPERMTPPSVIMIS